MAAIHNILVGAYYRPEVQRTFSSNMTQQTIDISTLPNYVPGVTDVRLVVNSGVYLYSTSTTIPALTITGGVAGDTVSLINNGFIIGQGGQGADSPATIPNQPARRFATAGGPALRVFMDIRLTNNGYIAGGGGGGGGSYTGAGGGGAGGGGGGRGSNSAASGVGGGPGLSGTDGALDLNSGPGGGGGRILPGVGGAGGLATGVVLRGQGGGAGGGGGAGDIVGNVNTGGTGGSAGNPGGTSPNRGGAGGGGGWGAVGGIGTGTNSSLRVAGAGGKAIDLNGRTVTYVVTGTVYGAVS